MNIITPALTSLASFFDIKIARANKKSRIVRRHNKIFDDFIFKGYDQQTPGLSRPGSFKELKMICKN